MFFYYVDKSKRDYYRSDMIEMKKILILMLMVILGSFSHQVVLANEEVNDEEIIENSDHENDEEIVENSDNENDEENTENSNLEIEEDYNEFGIKIGTEVYGEDISKLTEEELQYVPEGWRDGEFESEHPPEEISTYSIMSRFSYPQVNEYIRNMKVPSITYEHKNVFTKFNYRNGFGAVEGVVAHETANSTSTIRQEINYMTRNHRNAFVHAFVDHNNIIEIHPLDRGAWGAGRFANERFVHVELTRVHNFDHFAKSINNYADYIANILYDYNLGVTDAENTGVGSLWSHKAVSIHLGGTNHVDPHGYFASWGYSWNDFVKLVTLKYNKLALVKENTSKIGHIKSTNARIYNDPVNPYEYNRAGTNKTNAVYYIKQQANLNGSTYYLLSEKPSSTTGTIGWIKKQDADVHTHKGIDSTTKEFSVRGTGKAYNKAWGGSKNLQFNLSSSKGKLFKVNLTEAIGRNIWYRGILNGKQVWIHSSYLKQNDVKEITTSLLGHLKGIAKIYKDLENLSTFSYANGKYTNRVYYIKKEATTNHEKYYLISNLPSSSSGTIGWVKAGEITVHKHTGVDNRSKLLYIKGNGSGYTKAWGGDRDLVYSNLVSFAGEDFKVNLTEKVGNNTWYRGKLNGKTMWLHSSYVTSKAEVTITNISKLAHLRKSAIIYSDLDKFSTKPVNNYTNAVYYVKKQAIVKGTTYYLISTDPRSVKAAVGWVNSKDLDIRSHKTNDNKSKIFYIKGTGKAYSKVWGGAKDLIYSNLADLKHQQFKVNLTEKVGNNTWYRGYLGGTMVWLHSSYVSTNIDASISDISKLGHLRGKAKIYTDFHNENVYKRAKDGFTNAVYYIKKQVDLNQQRYYLISTEPSSVKGIVGWVKSNEIDLRSHKTMNNHLKTFIINGIGKAYNKAWGGSKDRVYNSLEGFSGEEFKVNLTEKVGNNTWYRGILKQRTVWIHSSYVSKK